MEVAQLTDAEIAEARQRCGGNIDRAAKLLGVPRDPLRRRIRGTVDDGDGLSHAIEDGFVEIPVIFRDYSHLDALRLYALGDVHLGAQSHQAERWGEWLQYLIDNPSTSLLGTGDFLNAAIPGAKSDVHEETAIVQTVKWRLADQLAPLAKQNRIDLLMPGNHEARIWRATGDCPIYDVARHLGVPYVKASVLMVYRVGNQTYEVYVRHGTGNGQALAGLSKSAMVIQADVYVTGHTHKQAVTPEEYFRRDGDRCVRRPRYFMSSGSFLGYESYAAERGYTPTRIGAPRIRLDGERCDVKVSV